MSTDTKNGGTRWVVFTIATIKLQLSAVTTHRDTSIAALNDSESVYFFHHRNGATRPMGATSGTGRKVHTAIVCTGQVVRLMRMQGPMFVGGLASNLTIRRSLFPVGLKDV